MDELLDEATTQEELKIDYLGRRAEELERRLDGTVQEKKGGSGEIFSPRHQESLLDIVKICF